MTVEELAKILNQMIADGKGEYLCLKDFHGNFEIEIDDKDKTIDIC